MYGSSSTFNAGVNLDLKIIIVGAIGLMSHWRKHHGVLLCWRHGEQLDPKPTSFLWTWRLDSVNTAHRGNWEQLEICFGHDILTLLYVGWICRQPVVDSHTLNSINNLTYVPTTKWVVYRLNKTQCPKSLIP